MENRRHRRGNFAGHGHHPGAGSSYPGYYATVGSITFFNATDPVDGSELWRTDGTAAGTYLVKDINPGVASSNPNNLTAYNGALYFFANDGTHGQELWKSDGTAAGTVLVDDINVGAGGQNNQIFSTRLIAVTGSNTLFFAGFDGTNTNLYTSTGAVGNETLVKTLQYGIASNLLASSGNLVFFTDNISYVYQSNGTTAGTIVDDSTNVSENNLTVAGNYLYYVRGYTVKCVGGGTVQNLPGSFTSPSILGVLGSTPFVQTFNNTAGHYQLLQVQAGGATDSLVMDNTTATAGTAVNGLFYFVTGSSTSGYALYKTNTLGLSPTFISNINAGGSLPTPTSLTALGSKLFFVNSDAVNGTQPWISDGTSAGTGLLKAVYPGTAGSSPFLSNLTADGRVFFSANDGVTGSELWSSDGTSANTVELKDINPGFNSSSPGNLLAVGNSVYFGAYDPTDGNALWVTDGTPGGTSLIVATDPGTSTSNPLPMAYVNGYVLFSATDSTPGTELWRTDGTSANTQLLLDINSGTASSSPSRAVVINGIAYFTATDSTHGTELWRSDGTTAGTYLVDDVYPGSGSSGITSLFVYGNMLLFSAESSTSTGYELWESDGTAAGTVLVKDIRSGSPSSTPSGFALYNGMVYFSATDSTGASGLWVTNGTGAGTQLIGEDSPTQLTPLNGKLYFIGSDGVHSSQLFVSQGTPSTTAPVNAVNPPTIQAPLAAIGGRLFFVAADTSGASYELWTSDGTSAGTSMIEDLFPGSGQGVVGFLVGLNGAVFARGDDSVYGSELYEFPDIYPPTVYAATATATGATLTRSINFSFTENVSADLSASSLQLQDLTTNQALTTSSTGCSYNTSTNTATFTLPAAALADGRYRATIPASLLVDPQGNVATSPATLEFVSVAVSSGTNAISLVPSSDGSSLLVYTNGVQTFATPWASLGSVVVTGGTGNDSLSITLGATSPSGGFSFDGGGGINTVTLGGTTGTHTVTSSSSGVNYDGVSLGALNTSPIIFNPAGGLETLNLFAPLALAASSATAVTVNSLNDNSSLDITNNAVDLTGSTFAAAQALVQSGFNSGRWSGTGINSSVAAGGSSNLTAVAVVQNNQGGTALFSSTHLFDGVLPAAADVLVKYTYYGDTNLDGTVDGSDYSRIDSAFLNRSLTGWYNGDFNYDGVINGSDYTLIDNAYNCQAVSLAASIASSQWAAAPTNAINGSEPITYASDDQEKKPSQLMILLSGL